MKILVCSCDKNEDTFEPFHHCMEKYWTDHPKVIYKTETIDNPYYETLKANQPISKWTDGMREVIEQIDDDQILLMMDDIFIRQPVDTKRIKEAETYLQSIYGLNVACMNFEKAFDPNDEETRLKGWKKRKQGSPWMVSIMCGLWQTEKLVNVLMEGLSPWDVEAKQEGMGYEYYINADDYIIDWGYVTYQPSGICRGKWQKECVWFFQSEGIKVDYGKRGIN